MVSRECSADIFRISAIVVFMRTCELECPDILGAEYANDESLREHIGFLKMLLPPGDVTTIAIANGWTVGCERQDGVANLQRFDVSEEAMTDNVRDVVRQLMMRIKTNLLAAGVQRDLLDVSFDDAYGFQFCLTDKAVRLQGAKSGDPETAPKNRELTLESVERFGYE